MKEKRGRKAGDVDYLYQPITGGQIRIKSGGEMAWAATLQQFVKPLQLFFSFCLNLEFVPLFSRLVVCAAAVCILIAIVPVSTAVIAASIATVIAKFFVVVWIIYCSLLKDIIIIIFELRKLLLFLSSHKY